MSNTVKGLAVLLASTAAVSAACGGADQPRVASKAVEPTRIALSVPDQSNSDVSVAALGDTVAAVWTSSGDAGSDIFISVSTDGGVSFRPPARVNDLEGDSRASGEQAARVAVGLKGAVHVVWPARKDGHSLIRYAGSSDGGLTFSPATTIVGDNQNGLRGWPAIALAHDGGVQAIWLDGRNATTTRHSHAKPNPTAGAKPARPGVSPRQDVFHAARTKDGKWSERTAATHVCFCCKTALATSGDRVYAAFRHIYPGSLRDIAVSRSRDNGVTFDPPIRVSEDGWKIDACPDDGPALTADGHGGVHIAWPTVMPGDTPRKGIFYSTLSGDAFAPRVRVDSGEGDPSHPQIVANHHTTAAVVWDERIGDSRRIVFREILDGAAKPPHVFDAPSGVYPVVAAGVGYWIVLWSSQDADGRSLIEGRRIPAPEATGS